MTLVQKSPTHIYKWWDMTAMQWPCDAGFHIPLSSEWQTVNSMGASLWAWTSSGYTNISNYLKLPLAWNRWYSDWSVANQWSTWYYWCSDVNWWEAYHFFFNSNWIFDKKSTYKCISHSIRAFKDTPVTPDSSWDVLYQWTWTAWIYHNSTLWLISISSDGQTWKTIADKNIWAPQLNYYWYTYQRWNNNWFWWGSVTTSSTKINASTYWPWNYYSSSTYIIQSSSPYSWDSSNNKNLWGWVSWQPTEITSVRLWETKVRPAYKPRTFTITRTEKSDMSSWWTYSDDAAWLTAGDGAFDDFFWYSAVLLNTSWVETAEMTQSWWVFTGAMTTLGNITSGDNVMIKFPARWIKMTKSWSVVTLSITDDLTKESEWYQYYAFQTWTLASPWTIKDKFYLGAYKWYYWYYSSP